MKIITFEEITSTYPDKCLGKAKFSSLFKRQIESFVENDKGEQYVFDEIIYLESGRGKTKTPSPRRFNHQPLKGLWKKHYLTPSFISKNIENHFRFKSEKFSIENILYESGARLSGKNKDNAIKIAEKVSKYIVWNTYKDKNQRSRWTGEWIIFAIVNGERYYLSIAKHEDEDEDIFEKIIENCGGEVSSFITRNGYIGDS